MHANLESLSATVQHNCHISDALHARDYTLCVYLLKMREYYRWEKGYSFKETLPSAAVGDWVTAREQLWEQLEASAFEPVRVGKLRYDPFDTEQINQVLLPQGLVYSAGYGGNARPHFFLGKLLRDERFASYTILISEKEYARDLTAPPGMSMQKTIFIRRESLRRMLWEKIEESHWYQCDNAMARAMAHYDFEHNLEAALDQMTDNEIEAVILHEIGEVLAGEMLGEAWHEMLAALPHSRAELMARAVRDHLADCLSTLPGLLETGHPAQLHFYFANMKAMRRELFPSLLDAYQTWQTHGDIDALKAQVRHGRAHWEQLALQLLAQRRLDGTPDLTGIEALVEAQRL
jgi:hypothetical protein